MTTRFDRLLACGTIALALLLAAPARGGDTEPGVWWEQTMQMEMPGMPMKLPAMKQKVCVSKNGMAEPPDNKDQNCKVTDLKHDGPKMTWKTECKDGGSGEGEIIQGKDRYDGTLTQHSKQGDMTAKISARLVGGDCDAAAVKKQVAAIQKQQEKQKKQMDENVAKGCDEAIESVELRLFAGPAAFCKKPEQVAQVCARISTRGGYAAYQDKASDPQMPKLVNELCKKDPETVRAKLCKQAAAEAKGESTSRDTLEFLAGNCPDETRALAKKVCAGRSFTGMPDKIRSICVEYAREELSKGKAQPASDETVSEDPPPKAPKEKAADKAKNVLKGLFGK
jgi:hypothetical protein